MVEGLQDWPPASPLKWYLPLFSFFSEPSLSITLTVDQDILTELGGAGEAGDFDYSSVGGGLLDRNVKNTTLVRPPWLFPFQTHFIGLGRKVSIEKLSQLSRDKMPGLRVSWSYNTSLTPDRNYLSKNIHFIKLANIVHLSDSTVTQRVKEAKIKLIREIATHQHIQLWHLQPLVRICP